MALIQRWWRVVCVAKAYLSAARLWCLPRTCCFFSNNTEQTPAWKQKHNTKVKQLKYQNIINIRFCNQVYTIMDSLRMPVSTCDTKSKTTVFDIHLYKLYIFCLLRRDSLTLAVENNATNAHIQVHLHTNLCVESLYMWGQMDCG